MHTQNQTLNYTEGDDALERQLTADLELEISDLADDGPFGAEANFAADAADQTARVEHEVLGPRSHGIMAAFHVYNDASKASRDDLAAIGKALTSIVTTQNLGREFLGLCEAEIIRASELEQANHRLNVENRRLGERAEKLVAVRERQNENLEAMRRRESRLLQDCDQLRETMSELRGELIELRNSNVATETLRSEMHIQLASKTAEAERISRETDVLREKITALTNDIELAQRKHGDARRKLEELQAAHTDEVNRNTELTARLVAAEKELLRVQKHNDATDVLLKELSEALQNVERDMADRDRRHESEISAQRSEIEQLNARLQRAASAQTPHLARPTNGDATPEIENAIAKTATRKPARLHAA